MDDFTVREMSLILSVDLSRMAEALWWVVIPPVSPLPHWYKSPPRINTQNA